jgi:hypothetical protein
MSTLFYVSTWAALAAFVVAMATYHYLLLHHEDATLDIMESASLASEQARVFKKAHTIELWGKALTIVVMIYGLALVGTYLYHQWQLGGQMPR